MHKKAVSKKAVSKKAVKRAIEPVVVPLELWEQMWRVVDAARFSVCPARGQSRDDALSFLADQEKMLQRGIAYFGREEALREGTNPHPYILTLEEQNRRLLREALRDEGSKGFV